MVVFAVIVGMWIVARAFAWVRPALQVLGPTNRLDSYVRTRAGMKWGLAICWPLAAACIFGAQLVERSSPSGNYAVWQLLVWALLWFDALKLVRIGIVSVVLLVRTRTREAHAARRDRTERGSRQLGVIDASGQR